MVHVSASHTAGRPPVPPDGQPAGDWLTSTRSDEDNCQAAIPKTSTRSDEDVWLAMISEDKQALGLIEESGTRQIADDKHYVS